MSKATRKAARQEKLAEDKQTNINALKAGAAILTMYGGLFLYFT